MLIWYDGIISMHHRCWLSVGAIQEVFLTSRHLLSAHFDVILLLWPWRCWLSSTRCDDVILVLFSSELALLYLIASSSNYLIEYRLAHNMLQSAIVHHHINYIIASAASLLKYSRVYVRVAAVGRLHGRFDTAHDGIRLIWLPCDKSRLVIRNESTKKHAALTREHRYLMVIRRPRAMPIGQFQITNNVLTFYLYHRRYTYTPDDNILAIDFLSRQQSTSNAIYRRRYITFRLLRAHLISVVWLNITCEYTQWSEQRDVEFRVIWWHHIVATRQMEDAGDDQC